LLDISREKKIKIDQRNVVEFEIDCKGWYGWIPNKFSSVKGLAHCTGKWKLIISDRWRDNYFYMALATTHSYVSKCE